MKLFLLVEIRNGDESKAHATAKKATAFKGL
jgi:hypothetical protein